MHAKQGRSSAHIILQNLSEVRVVLKKGTPIAQVSWFPGSQQGTQLDGEDLEADCKPFVLTRKEREEALFDKLDLSELQEWPTPTAEGTRWLLEEYQDLFSLETGELGQGKLVILELDCLSACSEPRRGMDSEKTLQDQVSNHQARTVERGACAPLSDA